MRVCIVMMFKWNLCVIQLDVCAFTYLLIMVFLLAPYCAKSNVTFLTV